ncbi:putative aquaporin 1 [Thelephora ganbajun]|uniref:Aquaporin 1 n=1 Tax=Thelephora ganbajun TaxID=370292 RepID=A0ACB6ZAI1_THEGA|nr:putative aquaporin 1 [Thelephora ganbajun]
MPLLTRPLFANIKQDFCGALLEFIGTFFFLTLAYGGVQATTSAGGVGQPAPNALNVFIASVNFGFSLLVSAWLFYRVTGGLFNPNVSLALFLAGVIGPVRFVLYCIAQLAGAIAAAAVILALSPGPCSYNTRLQEGINPAQGVFIEMFVTSYLVLAVLMLAVEKHHVTPFAPVGIGLTLFVCELWSIYYTGGAVNTARAFGPAVVTGFPYGTQWVYWVGPCLGSLLGVSFYMILKHWNYWVINPDQAVTDTSLSPPDPVLVIQQRAASLRRRPTDSGEQIRPRNGKPQTAANGSTGETQNGTPENHQEASQGSMV